MAITFDQAKEIVRAAEEANWTQGTYQIEDDGWRTRLTIWQWVVVGGSAEAIGDNPDPNFIIVPV